MNRYTNNGVLVRSAMIQSGKAHLCDGDDYTKDELADAIDQLSRYEDTSLTPDEIAALRAEVDQYKADIEAGRLVPVSYICGAIDKAVRVSVSPECGTVIEYESGRVRSMHPKWWLFRDFESMDDLRAALEGGQR